MINKYDAFTPYFTSADTINMAEDDTIGSLTRDDVVTLLKEIQKAMTLQYYNKVYNFGQTPPGPGYNLLASKGGQITKTGDQWKFMVVHADGEYGVYKLGITQLIDSGMFGSELNNWVSENLPNIPVPSKGNEQYESWYSRYLKYEGGSDTRIIEGPTSARNNALYYMLTHIINGSDSKFNVSCHPQIQSDTAPPQQPVERISTDPTKLNAVDVSIQGKVVEIDAIEPPLWAKLQDGTIVAPNFPTDASSNTSARDAYRLTQQELNNPEPPRTLFLDPKNMHHAFITQPQLQDLAASNLLKFTYQLLLTSRAINENIDKKTLAGALGLSICYNIDAVQNYLRGTVKSDENGVSAKYWFDVGFNAVALPQEKVETPGPTPGTTSVVKDEQVSPPPTEEPVPTVGETTVETAKTSNSPLESKEVPKKIVKTINNGSIAYELTPAGTISAKVTTGIKKTPAPASSSVTNPYYFIQSGIKITAEHVGAETYSLHIVDKIENNRDLFVGTNKDPIALSSAATTKLTRLVATERDSLHNRPAFGTWLLAIEDTIDWLVENYSSIASSQKELKSTDKNSSADDAESNKTIAFDDPADVETLIKQLDAKAQEAERSKLTFTYEACVSAKNDIQVNFTADTASISTAVSQSTQTATDGSSTSSVSTTESSGAVTTVTTTTTADGTVTQTKTIQKVEAPLKDAAPNNLENGIEHNLRSSESLNTQNNSPSANNLPSNEGTNVDKPENKGFVDPNKGYPKKEYVNKPDTNSLALGVNSPGINPDPRTPAGDKPSQSLGSSPAARNASRKRGVKTAGRSGATWEQPETPYAAKYPFNKVFAGESGHALEIDDTPGFERLNIAHKSGTFTETGPDGTQVNRIMGNGYSILEKDGYVLIEGNANVHIAGQCNVFIMNDTALTMHGKVSLDIHNDVNVNIGGSLGLSVQDGIYLRNEGDISVKNEGKVDAEITGAVTTKTAGKYNLTTNAGLNLTSKVNTHIKSGGAFFNHSTGNMNLCTDAEILAKSTGDINLKTAAMINQESTGNVNIKSAAMINQESTGNVNIKSAGTINAESTGNISLKAPLVTSSPIDTATLDVTTANITTLNAGTTNLKGTHNTPDDTTNIKGNTTASITVPASAGSAGSAEDAICAVSAKLPVTYELEQPVSLSTPQPVERTNNAVKTGYDGENDAMNSDGGEMDASGNRAPTSDERPCADTDADPSNPGNQTNTSDTGDPDSSSGIIPGKAGPAPKQCNTVIIGGKTIELPPLPGPGQRFNGELQLSPNFKLKDLCVTPSNGCPGGWKAIRKSDSGPDVPQILSNMRCLAVNVLEPLRAKYGKFGWSCGYRSVHPYKKTPDKGAHGYGAAIDINSVPGYDKKDYWKIATWIANNLKHDQVLLEKRGSSVWIHVGWVFKDGNQRRLDGTFIDDTWAKGGRGKFLKIS